LDFTQAIHALKQGELIIFPTETVYGLGADAANNEAMTQLYTTKGRPTNHPVIVHLGELEQLKEWAVEIPEVAYQLGKAFWPGPLTLILKKAPQVLDLVTGGQETIGLRIPNHPLALALLKEFKGGVAAPSANRFGKLSPTRIEDLDPILKGKVPVTLDGGPCQVGVESTIVDCTQEIPRILRPGMILKADIEAVLGYSISAPSELSEKPAEIRVSGSLESHYAPNSPVILVPGPQLADKTKKLVAQRKNLAVLAIHQGFPSPMSLKQCRLQWRQAPKEAAGYAQSLYQNLKQLDDLKADFILVEAPPEAPEWAAIVDRLQRASAPKPKN
jgi:L-threonylcarbamoyladenylate synthase